MQILLSPEDIQPIIERVVVDVLAKFGNDSRIAYTETEAAALIGVPRHVLRDERLRGKVQHGKCGKKVLYTRRQLFDFLESR